MEISNLDIGEEVDLLKEIKEGKSVSWDSKEGEYNVPEASENSFEKLQFFHVKWY